MVEKILKVNIKCMTTLPWHEVEKTILKEESWLSEIFDFGTYIDKDTDLKPSGLSNDKMLRQIAIAIVNGTVEAREIRSSSQCGLWSDKNNFIAESDEGDERHGSNWHRTMMNTVKQHFSNEGFEVINEPYLGLGRADLGVYKSGYPDLYVEIGTTSLFKTWFNINTMLNKILLFIPTTEYAIEFKIIKGLTHRSL